jgi:hypothetical protein
MEVKSAVEKEGLLNANYQIADQTTNPVLSKSAVSGLAVSGTD